MIRIENLGKSFGPKVLLNNLSFHFPSGERIALIGENGTGKSTLLNILSGIETCDKGEVLCPAKTVLGYLPQEPNPNPEPTVLEECEAGATKLLALKKSMEASLQQVEKEASEENLHAYEVAEGAYRLAGGYAVTSKASAILDGLGFNAERLKASPRSLSGGWRMRLELARLFMKDPDFLILDEPTNHLDLPSLVWVEKYLQTFPGTLLFVSHDRALLNRLASLTLHLHRGRLTPYKGNFDAFLAARELRRQQEASQVMQIQKKKEQLETFINRFGAKASKAKQAQSKAKQVERLEEEEMAFDFVEEEDTLNFSLPTPLPAERIVYQIANGAIGYTTPLCSGINVVVERGQKVAIIGANGIGKSTLLKTIIGKLNSLGGEYKPSSKTKISYFSQDQLDTLHPDLSMLDNVLRNTDIGQGEARSILGGFLLRGDDVFKATKVLSGGEKSRVGLACVLARKANFLLLDEPTNHLDMKSTASLIKALQGYEGTVMFVSHDRTLIDEVCTHVFVMTADGRSMLFEGKLDDYRRLAAFAGFPNVLGATEEASAAKAKEKPQSSVGQEDRYRDLKKQVAKLEKLVNQHGQDLDRYQEQIAAVDEEMAKIDSSDYVALQKAQKKHQELHNLLEDTETNWLAVTDELEKAQASLAELGRAKR